MIKVIKSILLSILFISTLAQVGCSNRASKPVISSDSTITYPPKDTNDVSASIKLYRKTDKKTGNLIGVGNVFTILENGNIHAAIEIKNRFLNNDKELLFHIDWTDEAGKSIYQKPFVLTPTDSISTLLSSISISPNRRKYGNYLLNVYYYRELIATKEFKMLPEFFAEQLDLVFPEIYLCKKINRETAELIGVDSVFMIKKRGLLRVFVDLQNREIYGKRDVSFRLDWVKDDTLRFYSKRIAILSNDTSSTFDGSISIATDKREPGNYSVQLSAFNKLIAKKEFILIPKPKVVKKRYNISANITFCRKINRKTNQPIDEANTFTIVEKAKVRALIELKNTKKYKNKKLAFHLHWIGANGKIFYRKQIDILPGKSKSVLKSAVSIPPGKRSPGNYSLQVYLFDDLISEKKFKLVSGE